jgi:hypothetical protein
MQRLIATIEQVINSLNYTLKIVNNDTIKIVTNKLEYHKTIIDIGLLYIPSVMQRPLIGYNTLHNALVVYV